ncbi:hypothetical protein C1631_005025 [Chryseobacterium phosphatilyticum]|uniref:Uncharacterized protein n=1 Tax=Chryseobacterium phosphatilyticum TaxID=475075 RepID=A0A316XKM5_9FLAO|nr:hypothetical protein C1631_005025 [Chryseobacterium phosphatilyticum]
MPTIANVITDMVSMEIPLLFAGLWDGEHERRHEVIRSKYPCVIFPIICVFIWFIIVYDQKIYRNFDF